jgi:hypothetical protein
MPSLTAPCLVSGTADSLQPLATDGGASIWTTRSDGAHVDSSSSEEVRPGRESVRP